MFFRTCPAHHFGKEINVILPAFYNLCYFPQITKSRHNFSYLIPKLKNYFFNISFFLTENLHTK